MKKTLLLIIIMFSIMSCEKSNIETAYEPNLKLSIEPKIGDVNTIFTITPTVTNTQDNLVVDGLSYLWEINGTFVTNVNIIKQQFNLGENDIKLTVRDTLNSGWASSTKSIKFTVNPDLTEPYAIFTDTIIGDFMYLDASNSLGVDLKYRWDWNNDGIWDYPELESYSNSIEVKKPIWKISNLYSSNCEDSLTITLEVKTIYGVTNTITNVIYL